MVAIGILKSANKPSNKMQKNDDVFEHAMHEVLQDAPRECLANMRDHLHHLKARCPHMEKSVDNCLKGLEGKPNMLRVLVAAYVLNGGVPLKYSKSKDSIKSREEDATEMDLLLKEMDAMVTKEIP